MTTIRVTALRRYPVKSLRGHDLPRAVVEPWGLEGDRRWMVVDEHGGALTARVEPRLLLLEPVPTVDGIRILDPDGSRLDVLLPRGDDRRTVQVWSDRVVAADAGERPAEWLSAFLGRAVRLVHLDDPTVRPVDPEVGREDDRVSFADGSPLHLTTTASLAALDEAIAERDPEQRVEMVRFRPNVVVTGADAWKEDDWRRIRIGGVPFRVAGGCARCVLTTTDPDTAARGKEPIRSLARIRRFDGATWFGIDLIPDLAPGERPSIAVGDALEVTDSVAAGAGPLRAGVA